MRVIRFFNRGGKKKLFMILMLTFPEKMALDKAGGLDKAIGSEGWVEGTALVWSLKAHDRRIYIFYDERDRVDFIYQTLAKNLKWKVNIKMVEPTPTFAQLLAKKHLAADTGRLNLYIDHDLPLQKQRQGKLWATYRAETQEDYSRFSRMCKTLWPHMEVQFWGVGVIVVWGYSEKGFARLQRDFNKHQGSSLSTNVLNAIEYPLLLLQDSI